jgi:hypothetical protein
MVSRDIVMDAVLIRKAIFSFLLFLIMIGMDVPGDLIKPGPEAAVFGVKRMTVTDDAVK